MSPATDAVARQAAIERAKGQVADVDFSPAIIRDDLRLLIAAAEAGERDAARLDFVESKMGTLYCSGDTRTHWVFVDETTPRGTRRGILGDTLRAAIDAARKG